MNMSTVNNYQTVAGITVPVKANIAASQANAPQTNSANQNDTVTISKQGQSLLQASTSPKTDPTQLFNDWLKRGSNQLEIVLGSGTKDTMLPENKPLYEQLEKLKANATNQRDREHYSGQIAELVSFGNKEIFQDSSEIDQRMQAVTMSTHLQEQYLAAKNGTESGIPAYQGPYLKDSNFQPMKPHYPSPEKDTSNHTSQNSKDIQTYASLENFNNRSYLINLLKNSSYENTTFIQNELNLNNTHLQKQFHKEGVLQKLN